MIATDMWLNKSLLIQHQLIWKLRPISLKSVVLIWLRLIVLLL